MRNVWNVFRYEFTRNVKRRAFLLTAFGIPLVGFLLFTLIQATSSDASADAQQQLQEEAEETDIIGYVDLAGLVVVDTEAFIQFDSEEAADEAMAADEIDRYYVIEPDYLETGNVTVVLPNFTVTGASGESFTSFLYRQYLDAPTGALLNQLVQPANVQRIELERAAPGAEGEGSEGEVVDEGDDSGFIIVYGFAMIFLLALFGTNGYLIQGVIEEKETKVVEILLSSLRPMHLLGGKILALGVLGIVQIVAWVGTVYVMTQLVGSENAPSSLAFLGEITLDAGTLLLMFIYFVLGYLFFAAVFGAVGALSVSMSEGPSYATVFTLPIILPFLMLTSFIETPNADLPTFLSIFPLTSPMAMVMRVVSTGGTVPFAEIALSLGLLLLLDIVMIWLAGRLFRVNTLLAGQMPKLREIPALIRGA